MDSITIKSIAGEFLGSLGQSAVLTAVLYNHNKNSEPNMLLLIAAIIVTVVIFYYWTSVRLNPFISLGVTLTQDNPDWIRLLTDLIAQIAGGICGVYLTSKLLDIEVNTNKAEEEYVTKNRLRTVISDAIFTFALVLSFIALTSDFKQGLMIGLGIALVYASSIAYNKGRSGGNINYANRVGIAIATRNFSNLFVYTIGPLIGAIVAVCGWYIYKNKFATLFHGCATLGTETIVSSSERSEVPLSDPFLADIGQPHGHPVGQFVQA